MLMLHAVEQIERKNLQTHTNWPPSMQKKKNKDKGAKLREYLWTHMCMHFYYSAF